MPNNQICCIINEIDLTFVENIANKIYNLVISFYRSNCNSSNASLLYKPLYIIRNFAK